MHLCICRDCKLLCDDSDGESSDEELLSSKIVAVVQYAAMSNV